MGSERGRENPTLGVIKKHVFVSFHASAFFDDVTVKYRGGQ